MACKSFYHVRYHSSTLRNDGQMFTSMGRPDKAILRMREACNQKAPDCRLQIPGTATMAYLPSPRSGWMATIYFIRWLKVTRTRGWYLTKRTKALSFGRLHIPSSMPLLILRLSKNDSSCCHRLCSTIHHAAA
jgi:hypothetical protein